MWLRSGCRARDLEAELQARLNGTECGAATCGASAAPRVLPDLRKPLHDIKTGHLTIHYMLAVSAAANVFRDEADPLSQITREQVAAHGGE